MNKSPQSIDLYNYMIKKGYPEGFADIVTQNLSTDFTASRMMGYLLLQDRVLPLEVVTDEMLAILDLRQQIMDKHAMENTQARINQMMDEGFGE